MRMDLRVRKIVEFPCIFPTNREFWVETIWKQTASTTTHFRRTGFSRHVLGKPAVSVPFRGRFSLLVRSPGTVQGIRGFGLPE
jgi:hypothetical protein